MKAKNLLLIASALVAICGCESKEPEPAAAEIKLNGVYDNSVTLSADGVQDVTIVVSSNYDWSISKQGSDWLTVEPTSGKADEKVSVKLSAAENTSTDKRQGSITITADNAKTEISVNQAGADASLTVAPDIMTFPGVQGENQSITITSNVDWTLQADAEWIVADKTSGTAGETAVSISVPTNPGKARTGKVIVISDAGQTLIVVEQADGPEFKLSAESAEFTANPEEPKTVTITSNVDWTLQTEGDWFTTDKTSGTSGETTVTITAQENTGDARTGKITFTSAAGESVFTLSQIERGIPTITCETKELKFSKTGGTSNVTVTSNISWTATSSAEWLTVTPETGKGKDVQITVTASENMRGDRTATISFAGEDVEPVEITVTQESTLRLLATWNTTSSKEEFAAKQPKWDISLKSGKYEDPDNKDLCTLIADDGINEAVWYCAHRADGPQSAYYRTAFSSQPAINGHWWDDGLKFYVKGVSASAGQKLVYVGALIGANANSLAYWGVKFSLDGGQTWNEGETSIYYSGELVPCLSVVSKSHEVNSVFTLTKDLVNQDIIVFLYVIPDHHEGVTSGTTVTPTSEPKSLHNTIRFARVQNPHLGEPVDGPTIWAL